MCAVLVKCILLTVAGSFVISTRYYLQGHSNSHKYMVQLESNEICLAKLCEPDKYVGNCNCQNIISLRFA